MINLALLIALRAAALAAPAQEAAPPPIRVPVTRKDDRVVPQVVLEAPPAQAGYRCFWREIPYPRKVAFFAVEAPDRAALAGLVDMRGLQDAPVKCGIRSAEEASRIGKHTALLALALHAQHRLGRYAGLPPAQLDAAWDQLDAALRARLTDAVERRDQASTKQAVDAFLKLLGHDQTATDHERFDIMTYLVTRAGLPDQRLDVDDTPAS